MKTYDEQADSIRFYRTTTVVLVLCIAYIGMNNIKLNGEKNRLATVIVDHKYAENASNTMIEGLMSRIDELEGANEALMGSCIPSSKINNAKEM